MKQLCVPGVFDLGSAPARDSLFSVIEPSKTPEYFSVVELAEHCGTTTARIRSQIQQRELAGLLVDGVYKVPALFLVDGQPLSSLRGTLIVLEDSGFGSEEAVRWLLTPHDELAMSPVQALREGFKTRVRRLALALAF